MHALAHVAGHALRRKERARELARRAVKQVRLQAL